MRHFVAVCALPCLGALVVGCYRSHQRPGDGVEDAGELRDSTVPDEAGGCCSLRCGDERCDESRVCTASGCAARCEHAACGGACCAEGEVCAADGTCRALGAECSTDDECVAGELCDALGRRCVPRPAEACTLEPPPGEFSPVVQWQYTDRNVWSMPVVVQLTDDDGDGATGVSDVPDVVVVAASSYTGSARIMAFSGDDGHLHWETEAGDVEPCRFATPAAGDLDGDGSVEIVAIVAEPGGQCVLSSTSLMDVAIFDSQGNLVQRIPVRRHSRAPMVSVADFDADGSAEIFALGALIRADGEIVWRHEELNHYISTSVGDLDGDGRLEVAATNLAVDDDGSVLWRGGSVLPDDFDGWGRGTTALARLVDVPSSDGVQVVAVGGSKVEILDGRTGEVLLGPIRYSHMAGSAGPPTVADFDADGRPEIGVAGEEEYVVFDLDLPSPHIRWTLPSHDFTTGSVGSTVFDFDGDGAVEVVYGDECHLQILDGRDGSVIWMTGAPNATIFEYPVVVDVDRDGNAEIVAVSNLPSDEGMWHEGCRSLPGPYRDPVRGLRVFRDRLDHWVPTRSVWNQHAYHIDNVEEDGSIPRVVAPSWETHNSYRRNRLSGADDAVSRAPDLTVTAVDVESPPACGAPGAVRARVENRGWIGVPPGVPVTAYDGADTALGTAFTETALVPGGVEWVEIGLASDADGSGLVIVADDDGMGEGVHAECREGNNRFEHLGYRCHP